MSTYAIPISHPIKRRPRIGLAARRNITMTDDALRCYLRIALHQFAGHLRQHLILPVGVGNIIGTL